jgi:glutaminyl-peptide cyclotransferase
LNSLRLLTFFIAGLTSTFALGQQGNKAVSGQAVYALTQQYLAAAPKRYVGSPGHLKAEEFIKSHFAPEAAKNNFIVDEFYANTPAGQMQMRNLIVKFPGKKDGVIVLASHYETN